MAFTDPLARLLETVPKDIRKAFLEAFEGIKASVDMRQLVAALEVGDIRRALELVSLEPARFRSLERSIFVAYETGGVDITAGIDRRRRANVQALFDMADPEAKRWIEGHTTDLIRQISDDQRRLVETALSPMRSGLDPLITGDTPQKLALDLVGRVNPLTKRREGGIIGLTTEQAKWAANYADELAGVPDPASLARKLRAPGFDKAIRKAIANNEPLPEKIRQAAIASYRNKALRQRAENIAGNEAHAVLLQAQQDAWDQAIRRGVVEAGAVVRKWVTYGDDRVRQTHAAVPGMNPDGVGLKEPFRTPLGPAMVPGWSFEPGCRCRVLIRVKED